MAERCINPIRILPESVSKQRKAEQLRLATAAARAYHDAVTQTRAGYLEVMKHVLVANSEGIWGEENRTRSRFTIEAVASSATEKQSGHLGPGGSEGYELFDRITALGVSFSMRPADMVWRQRRWQEMRPFSQEDWDSRLHPLW